MKKKKSLNIIGNTQENTSEDLVSRRSFLKVLGAGTALGLSACADSTKQKIFPDLEGNSAKNPGVAVWYNSTCRECEAGCGISVRTREGRAVKIEGNANHPVNKGSLCATGQAALQGLYDPDRIREPLQKELNKKGQPFFKAISWDKALAQVSSALKGKGANYIIRGEETGSLEKIFDQFSSKFNITQNVWDITSESELAESSKRVFGTYGIPHYKFGKAEVILSFGANFLETWVSPVEFAREFAEAKRKEHPVKFFHVEPRLSMTGSNADLWLKSKPGSEVEIAKYLIAELVKSKKGQNLGSDLMSKISSIASSADLSKAVSTSGISQEKLTSVIDSLVKSKSSLVIAGGTAGSFSNDLLDYVNIINLLLGNVGKTVLPGLLRKPKSNLSEILKTSKELNAKAANLLITYNCDPVLNLPVEAGFEYGVKKSKLHVSFSSHFNETTRLADIILPANTSLESWGDANPRPGVKSLMQPVMQAVFNTKEVGDILIDSSKKAGQSIFENGSFQDYVKAEWLDYGKRLSRTNIEKFWKESLEKGGYFTNPKGQAKIESSGFKPKSKNKKFISPKGIEKDKIVLYPYTSIRDFSGKYANRPWLQELPDPVTKIVWSSWAEIHPKTANRLGLSKGDTVSVSNFYGEVQLPVYTTNYVSENTIAVPVSGTGEQGRYANQAGNGNIFSLLASAYSSEKSLRLLSTEVNVKRSRISRKLVQTQGSDSQLGRGLAETELISEDHSKGHDDHSSHHGKHHEPEQMYKQRTPAIYDWGMNIDLASCTGCSACVVACYAENNISVVGKEVCDQGREMSWLRIERYYDGDEEDPKTSHLPMMCQHCDNAPCEPVCPVYATYHTEEGLNAMVYNRCVGTRYCGNNCSYKVRRFNWFEFDWPEPLNLQINPDVTKRVAGVMEKCTFCIQRINEAKDTAKDEGRLVRDGEVQPACAQTCPTKAITFGNRKDPDSNVSKLGAADRAYKVLDHHLNTQPSVTYLKDRRYKV